MYVCVFTKYLIPTVTLQWFPISYRILKFILDSSYISRELTCPRPFTASMSGHQNRGRDAQRDAAALSCCSPCSYFHKQFQTCLLSSGCSEICVPSSESRTTNLVSHWTLRIPAFTYCGSLSYIFTFESKGFSWGKMVNRSSPCYHVVLPKLWRETEQCGHRTRSTQNLGFSHLHSFSTCIYVMSNNQDWSTEACSRPCKGPKCKSSGLNTRNWKSTEGNIYMHNWWLYKQKCPQPKEAQKQGREFRSGTVPDSGHLLSQIHMELHRIHLSLRICEAWGQVPLYEVAGICIQVTTHILPCSLNHSCYYKA